MNFKVILQMYSHERNKTTLLTHYQITHDKNKSCFPFSDSRLNLTTTQTHLYAAHRHTIVVKCTLFVWLTHIPHRSPFSPFETRLKLCSTHGHILNKPNTRLTIWKWSSSAFCNRWIIDFPKHTAGKNEDVAVVVRGWVWDKITHPQTRTKIIIIKKTEFKLNKSFITSLNFGTY